jgi:hypothetical protein
MLLPVVWFFSNANASFKLSCEKEQSRQRLLWLQELLAEETGIELEKDENAKIVEPKDDDEAGEEVTFDRCFYIYGGPEHLEVRM